MKLTQVKNANLKHTQLVFGRALLVASILTAGIATILASPIALAGHRVGNGGDHIRATFIRMGEAVISFLDTTEQGQALVKANNLDTKLLAETLDIEKISVTDDVLRDSSGSVVEAIGVPGHVDLNKESWFNHFEKSRDVYYFVFHEMLRSAGVNDDNYLISKGLQPFPTSLRIESKVVPTLPLIAQDNLSNVFDLQNVTLGGSGCGQNTPTRVEFNYERNILEISTQNYRAEIDPSRGLDRKTCMLAIPVKVPKSKRLVISQIDLLGKIDIVGATSAQLKFEAFMASTSAVAKTRTFTTDSQAPLFGKTLTRRTEVLKTKCGTNDIVRLNSSALIKGQPTGFESLSVEQIALSLNLEDCK